MLASGSTRFGLCLQFQICTFLAVAANTLDVQIRPLTPEIPIGFPVVLVISITNPSDSKMDISFNYPRDPVLSCEGLKSAPKQLSPELFAKVITRSIPARSSIEYCYVLNNDYIVDQKKDFEFDVLFNSFIYTDTTSSIKFEWKGLTNEVRRKVRFRITDEIPYDEIANDLSKHKYYGHDLSEKESVEALKSFSTKCSTNKLLNIIYTWTNLTSRDSAIRLLCERIDPNVPSLVNKMLFSREFSMGNISIKKCLEVLEHNQLLDEAKLIGLLSQDRDISGTLAFLDGKVDKPFFPRNKIEQLLKQYPSPTYEIHQQAVLALTKRPRQRDVSEIEKEFKNVLERMND